jgi:antitoxin HigA-1
VPLLAQIPRRDAVLSTADRRQSLGGEHDGDIDPIHPGEVLLEEFLRPMEATRHRLAVAIGVPQRRITEIVHGKRRITADTALRLARYFGTTDRFWLNLQTRYDLEVERDCLGAVLEAINPLHLA